MKRIDPDRARREWRIHQAYAWALYGVLALLTGAFVAVGLEVVHVQAMISLCTLWMGFNLAVFCFSDRIVVWMTSCEEPSGEQRARMEACLARLLPGARVRAPRLYVSRKPEPNAFAFGNGLWFSGMAVTDGLLTLLDDQELEAVIGHELGHLRAHDVWAATLVSALLSTIHAVAERLRHVGNGSGYVSLVIEGAIYLPRVVASAISQLREYAADAFSASVTGDTDALVSAFRKLEGWKPPGDRERPERGPLDELMLSHPRMDLRIDMLNRLSAKES